MREIRTYGSEGGEAKAFPTPRAGCEWKSVIGCSRFDDIKELAPEDRYNPPLGEPFAQFRGLL